MRSCEEEELLVVVCDLSFCGFFFPNRISQSVKKKYWKWVEKGQFITDFKALAIRFENYLKMRKIHCILLEGNWKGQTVYQQLRKRQRERLKKSETCLF